MSKLNMQYNFNELYKLSQNGTDVILFKQLLTLNIRYKQVVSFRYLALSLSIEEMEMLGYIKKLSNGFYVSMYKCTGETYRLPKNILKLNAYTMVHYLYLHWSLRKSITKEIPIEWLKSYSVTSAIKHLKTKNLITGGETMKLQDIKLNAGNSNSGNFLNLNKAIPDNGTIKLRLVGDVASGARYWVKNNEDKSRPINAFGYNPTTQEWDRLEDDILYEIALKKFNDTRLEMFYLIKCINREDNKAYILHLKQSILRQLISLAEDSDYSEFLDEENGLDITVKKEKTGPLPMNVKYSIIPGRKETPITEIEKTMLEELGDLNKLVSPMQDKDDYIQKIKEFTTLLDDYEKDSVTEF